MATNPRIPDQNDPNRRGPVLLQKPEPPRSAVPGVVLAIITAALILAAVLYFMPRAPKSGTPPPAGAEAPAQPVPGQLQFSAMNMTADPTGRSVELDGLVTNNSRETINGIVAQVKFTLKNGQTVNVNAPVASIDLGAHKGNNGARINASAQNLVKDPIKAGQERGIVINVANVPDGWDHTMPGLTVLTTTGTSGEVKNK